MFLIIIKNALQHAQVFVIIAFEVDLDFFKFKKFLFLEASFENGLRAFLLSFMGFKPSQNLH